MKKALAFVLSVVLLATTIIPLGLTAMAANAAPTVIPAIRQWTGSSGNFTPNASTVLVNKNNSSSVAKVQGFFEEMLGLKLGTSATADGSNEIVFIKDTSLQSQVGKEGYTLTATTSKIEIKAPTDTGLLYGGITVVQSVSADGAFPCGTAVDYPEYEVRSGMLDVGRAWIPLDYVEEITRYMAYFKMNEMHLHINDDGVNGYSGFRLESNIKGLASKDGYYTKDEYRAYQKKMLEYGVTVITEIDTPYHSSCYANAENPPPFLPNNYRCLDISKPETVTFVKNLLAEYMTGDDPVFVNKIVHIGTDEYPREYAEQMRAYTDTLIDYVNSLGYTPRFWGGLGPNGFKGTTPISENAQMNFWDVNISGVEETLASDYDIINTVNNTLYVVPTTNYNFPDYFDLERLYTNWQVNYFDTTGTKKMAADDERLLGASFALWNDLHTSYNGVTRFDIFDRLRGMTCLIAEKTWLGHETTKISAANFIERYEKLSLRAGDADPGRHSVPAEGLSVDFEGTLPEYVKLNGGKVENGVFVLDGTSYLSLTPDAVGFPNTLEFDIYLEEATTAPLFAGDGVQILANADGQGHFGFKTEFYTFTYDYKLPTGKKVTVRLSSDTKKTTLIVDGRRYSPKNALNVSGTKLSTLTAPLSQIGKGVKGYIDNINVLPQSAYLNVALGAQATASSLEVNDGRFTANLAVDGIDDAASRLSFSRDADNQWLLLDLGSVYSILEFEISFHEHVPSYEILVSEDGTNFTSVYKLTGGQNGSAKTDKITLNTAADARYIKYVQLQRWEHASWGKYSGGIREFRAFSFGEAPDGANKNLVLGKEYFGTHERSEYYADLTDGKALASLAWDHTGWFGFFYHPGLNNEDNISQRNSNAPNGIGTVGFDLEGVYDLSQVRVNTFLGNNSGIALPEYISVETSLDGETYEEADRQTFANVASDSADARKVGWVEFDFVGIRAQYVRLKFDLRAPATMAFINEIEVYGEAVEVEDPTPDPEPDPNPDIPANLLSGKDYFGTHARDSYYADLTDGNAKEAISFVNDEWFCFYYHPDLTEEENINDRDSNAPGGIGVLGYDLEGVYDLTKIRVNAFLGNYSGIVSPEAIYVEVSLDGETYEEVARTTYEKPADGDRTVGWVEFDLTEVQAQYIRIGFDLNGVMAFLNEVEAYGELAEVEEPTPEPEPDPDPEYVLGDVDNDGDVDSIDYLFIKRYCLNTYDLTKDELVRADVNKDETVDTVDYVLVKRIVLGTYTAQ